MRIKASRVAISVIGLALVLLVVRFVMMTIKDDALLRASQTGDLIILRSALSSGSDANYAFEGDVRPLMLAVSNDRYKAAEILLEAGADPTLKNYQGLSSLQMAKNGRMWNLLNKYANGRKK